jgi:hypothetical protein
MQQQRHPQRRREPLDRVPHPVAQRVLVQHLLRARCVGHEVQVGAELLFAGTGAQSHSAGVAHDHPQPWPDRVRVAHVADPAQRDQCGLLHRVLGIGSIAEDREGDRAHVRLVPGQQHAERREFAGLGVPGQQGIR